MASRPASGIDTVLVAPKSYIKLGHGFDAAVTLEQVGSFLSSGDLKRQQFKSKVIQQAIEKADQIGPQVVNQTMTTFREAYFALFKDFFKNYPQDVTIRHLDNVWIGETWFRIHSQLLPKRAYVHHKSDRGFVDLTFPDTDAKRLSSLEPLLVSGMTIHQTGKSAAIRFLVPTISSWGNFDQERHKVTDALSAATKLLEFYLNERTRLDAVLSTASTRI